MPYLLRMIRKARWHTLAWLTEGALQADALGDLATKDNRLSVWHVEDDRSNLNELLAALAGNRDYISHLDYALLDYKLIFEAGITIECVKGRTRDREASSNWHRDLVKLSASRLIQLARAIKRHAEKQRVQEREVERLIREAVRAGRMNLNDLPDKVKGRIREFREPPALTQGTDG